MRFPTPLFTAFFALASAYPSNETNDFYLTITDIVYSSYYTFVSPSASGPKQGVISFTLENNDIDEPIYCKAVNSNPFAVFYASTEYECVSNIGSNKDMGKTYEGPYCWTNSVSFTFSTESLEQRILTVDVSWTCENEGVYSISVGSLLDLDCENYTCTNNLWPEGVVYSNTTTVCDPTELSFPDAEVQLAQG